MKQKDSYLSLIVIISAVVCLHGQTPQRIDTEQSRETERRLQAERERRNARPFDTAKKATNRPDGSVLAAPTIDKETSERIRLARRVDATDVARYSEFLKSEKTGIFKLFPDHDCVTKNVVRTDGDCKDFVLASSSFSFRTGDYAHAYYHDLGFNKGEVFSNAFFSQGILVKLGDVPIEDVTTNREGLKFIFDFQTASDPGAAKSSATRFKNGIESGGFTYTSRITPAENTTFALRSIAYNIANSLPQVSETTSVGELRFHTLSLDKRADVIVVFRIVRMGADGSLTIVWKELDRKEAPKIKFAKNEKFADFKADNLQTQH